MEDPTSRGKVVKSNSGLDLYSDLVNGTVIQDAETLSRQLDEQKTKSADLTAKCYRLGDENDQLRRQTSELMQQSKSLQMNISCLYQTAKLEIDRKDGEILTLRARLEALDKAATDLSVTAGDLKANNDDLKASNEQLRTSNEVLKASNESFKASHDVVKASYDELKATSDTQQSSFDTLKARSDEMALQLQQAVHQLSSIRRATLLPEPDPEAAGSLQPATPADDVTVDSCDERPVTPARHELSPEDHRRRVFTESSDWSDCCSTPQHGTLKAE